MTQDFRSFSRALVDQDILVNKMALVAVADYLYSIPDTKVEVKVEEDFMGAFQMLRLASRELDEVQVPADPGARLSGKLVLQGAARYLIGLQDQEVKLNFSQNL